MRFYQQKFFILKKLLGSTAFEARWAEGRRTGLDEALIAAENFLSTIDLAQINQIGTTPAAHLQSSGHRPEKPAPAAEKNALSELTGRELDVLKLVAKGLTNPQVAQELFLSPLTVNAYLRSIYSKLNVTSRTAASRIALESGLN